MAKKYTKEQIENIKNYGDSIETLENAIEAIKKLPGMYIGHKSSQGIINTFREIFQNSVDEIMRSVSPCDTIWVTFDERSCTFIVEDNGRGIPFGKIIDIYTLTHTSSNFDKDTATGEYTSGTHGIGAKITNALSEKFIVESYILGEARRVEFDYGNVWDKGELPIPNTDDRQGTMIMFTPNFEIMGDVFISYNEILSLLKMIWCLTTLNSKLYFKAIAQDGTEHSEVLVNSDGINTLLANIVSVPFIKPISFSDDNGTSRASIVLTYDSNDLETVNIEAFSNFCKCDGSHVDGFTKGISEYFRNYMNKIFLNNATSKSKKKTKLVINSNDITCGLRAVIDAAHISPLFTGQAKETIDKPDMEAAIKALTIKSLEAWTKTNPAELQKLCKRFKDVAELRLKSEQGKLKLSNKYNNGIAGYPAKFIKPTSNNWEDFIICEGDSAKGGMENNRQNATQGILGIRGKIINCLAKPRSECLNNEEVRAIINIVGGGFGKDFDMNKVRWKKIIFAADGDPDGAHICNLLLRVFIAFMPELIDAGMIYKAIPPLYSINKKGKTVYFTDRFDYIKYLKSSFEKTNTIAYTNGNKLTSVESLNLISNNVDYVYNIEKVAGTYQVSPKLLELVMFNINKPTNDLEDIIRKQFRFINIEHIRSTLAVMGSIDFKYNTLFLNDKLTSECKTIIDIINSNAHLYYNLNNERCSLYELMKKFESSSPSKIQRYKGLGEMDPKELAKTVVLPGDKGDRVLIRYTLESANEEIEKIRYYEKNKKLFLEGLTITRSDLTD